MAKGKHAPNKGALKQAEKVNRFLVMQCSWDSYKRCCILEAEKLGELLKKQLIVETLRSRERLLFSPQIIQTSQLFNQGWPKSTDIAGREVILVERGVAWS